MNIEDIYEGAELKIRSWDDMVECFGFYEDDNTIIQTDGWWFISSMKHICGKKFTVQSIVFSPDGDYEKTYFRSVENSEFKSIGLGFWYIGASMLEPLNPEEFYKKSHRVEIEPETFFNLIK